jgi:hypothetical protein
MTFTFGFIPLHGKKGFSESFKVTNQVTLKNKG